VWLKPDVLCTYYTFVIEYASSIYANVSAILPVGQISQHTCTWGKMNRDVMGQNETVSFCPSYSGAK